MFFTSTDHRRYKLWSCQNVCDALSYFWILFTSDLVMNYTDKMLVFRWVQSFAPLVADSILFCHERDFKTSFSDYNQPGIIKAFNSIENIKYSK